MLIPLDKTLKVATLVCPDVFMIDIVGAHSAFALSPNVETHLVWKTLEPFKALPNWPMTATTTLDKCPDVDVLIVGAVGPEVIGDTEVIDFIKEKGKKASAIIGICGGVLVLGAAGLLEGRRATTNFHIGEYLKEVGAIPVLGGEVVVDGNLYTAGPAHGSMEAALIALGALRGEEVGKLAELNSEYDPHPPFKTGSPELAGPELTAIAMEITRQTIPFDLSLKLAREGYLKNRPGANV